jgi:hypothetical protein
LVLGSLIGEMKTVLKQIALSLVFISLIVSPTLAFDMQSPEEALGFVGVQRIAPAPSPVATGELRALAASLGGLSGGGAGEASGFQSLGSDTDSVDELAESGSDNETSDSEPQEIRRLDRVFSDYVMKTFVRRD